MTKNPARRLGCIDGEDSIRKHPFFKGKFVLINVNPKPNCHALDMDWDALEQRKVRPPFRPRVVSLLDHIRSAGFVKFVFVSSF